MIQEVVQDIFNSNVDVIIHQANCCSVMGSGIAKEIKERFPEAYEADKAFNSDKWGSSPRDKLGKFSVGVIKKEHRNTTPNLYLVYNLYGQLNYGKNGRFTDYEAFYSGLELIKKDINERNRYDAQITRVGIPWKIASNQAGADWKIIKSMIEVVFDNSNLNVKICKKP